MGGAAELSAHPSIHPSAHPSIHPASQPASQPYHVFRFTQRNSIEDERCRFNTEVCEVTGWTAREFANLYSKVYKTTADDDVYVPPYQVLRPAADVYNMLA